MGWTDYSNTATTNSEKLKERIKKAFFHFKGPHTSKSMNLLTKRVEEMTEIVEFDCLDLAVLFGIRETCYRQKGDAPLNKEEAIRFLKTLNKQLEVQHYIIPNEEYKTQSLDELVAHFNEWVERLVEGKVEENEDGSVEVRFDFSSRMDVWEALTIIYPESEIDVWEYEDFSDGETWFYNHYHFIVSGGKHKQVEHIYNEGGSD